MVTADKRAAILAKAELLAGRSLGDSGNDLTEMAVQRACAYCNRPDVPEEMEQAVAALVGLIPNCAASILITQLFLEGAISFGSAVAGLCTGAGIGLVVLFKTSRNKKECFAITGILYLIAVIAGMILQLIG